MPFPSRVKEPSKPGEQKPRRSPPPSPCSEVAEQTQAPLPLPPASPRAGREGRNRGSLLPLPDLELVAWEPAEILREPPLLTQTSPGASLCWGL